MKSTPAPTFPLAWEPVGGAGVAGTPALGWSLLQPWATLVAHGYKRLETRSRSDRRHGRVAIHASLGKTREARQACQDPHIAAALQELGYTFDTLPRGQVLATATIIECQVMVEREPQAENELDIQLLKVASPREYAFGFYAAGRYAYSLGFVERCAPLPAKGALGFWKLPTEVTAALTAAVQDRYATGLDLRAALAYTPPPGPAPRYGYVMGLDFSDKASTTTMALRHPDGTLELIDHERTARLIAEWARLYREPLTDVQGLATSHPFALLGRDPTTGDRHVVHLETTPDGQVHASLGPNLGPPQPPGLQEVTFRYEAPHLPPWPTAPNLPDTSPACTDS